MKTREEIKTLAATMRAAEIWNDTDCRDLCEAAGMLEAYEAADGESFEAVVMAAADALNVEII